MFTHDQDLLELITLKFGKEFPLFIPWNPLIFPDFLRFLSCIFLKFSPYLFFLNVASTYHWSSVHTNTNLLQIHFAKVKPPHIATPKTMYISTTFYLSTHSQEFSLIKKTFSLILAGKPWFFPDFLDWKKF